VATAATFFGASPSPSLSLDLLSTFFSDASETSFFSVELLEGASPSDVFDDDDDDLAAGACDRAGGEEASILQRRNDAGGGTQQRRRTSPSDLVSFFSSTFFSAESSLEALDEEEEDEDFEAGAWQDGERRARKGQRTTMDGRWNDEDTVAVVRRTSPSDLDLEDPLSNFLSAASFAFTWPSFGGS
jgi:hypothetical protein